MNTTLDFHSYKKLLEIFEEKDVFKKDFKEKLKKNIKSFEEAHSEEYYLEELGEFKKNFQEKFRETKISPTTSKNCWAGLPSKNLALLFKGSALEMYLKVHWKMNIYSHPNPEQNFTHLLGSKGNSRYSPLIYGMHSTIWTAKLLTEISEIITQLDKFMDKLNKILINKL